MSIVCFSDSPFVDDAEALVLVEVAVAVFEGEDAEFWDVVLDKLDEDEDSLFEGDNEEKLLDFAPLSDEGFLG